MRQKEKSGSAFNISFYISLILLSLSGLLGHRILRLGVSSHRTIRHRTKRRTNALYPHPTIHILKLTRQQVLILSTTPISPNGCLKIPFTGRKYLFDLVLPQSICGLKSLGFPLLLIQPLSQSEPLYITGSLCLLHLCFPNF